MNSQELLLGSTSIHGLQQAGRNKIFGPRAVFFWCCAFLASISLMSVHINNLTIFMMSYPKVVKYELSGGDLTFPSVTVCNMGLVRKSALDKIPTFMAMGTVSNSPLIITTVTPSTTYVPPAKLQCQQQCDYWEPFCFLRYAGNYNFSYQFNYCEAAGGSLPTFVSSNITYFQRFVTYMNQTSPGNLWFFGDYINNSPHNTTNIGIWTDHYGRVMPTNFFNWSSGYPCGICYWNEFRNIVSFETITPMVWADATPTELFQAICVCHCPSVQAPLHGIIVGDNFTDLTATIQFACDPGLRLIGSPVTTCQYGGSGVDWSTTVPFCLLDCAAIVSQMFTVSYQNQINNINTSSFSVAIFACPTGFTIYGRNSSTCYNGSWDILANDYPLCSDIPFPSVSESQFLTFAGNNSNTINAATTFTSLLPYLLSSLSDAQMVAIGFNETQIVVKCTFDQKDCQKLDIVAQRDAQNGMCYTFNHKNMSKLYTVDRSGLNYGLKLLLFSLQDEYLPIIVSGGLKVFIGDQNDPIFFGQNGFMVTPGLTYSIGLRKEMELKLNVPRGLCVETASKVQYYNFINTSYFQEACISSFVQSQIVNKCGCSAPTLPVNDSFIPVCGVVQHNCVQQVYDDNDSLVDMAKTFCPQSCSSTYYQRTSTTWTSRVNEPIARRLSVSDSAYLKNAVDISIYFEDLKTVTLQEELSYTVVNLLSDLGASMGVLVGMSVVSWVEFIYAMAELVVFLVKKMMRN